MLHGRQDERAALAALLDGVRASHSGVLVLRGRPGVGKSALLAAAVEQAGDMQVLRAQGIESESEFAFAALHQLLRPVLGLLDALPAPQASALRVAFGLQQAPGGGPFLVSLAALSLLAEAAEQRPVLCVVDDAHWLDEASANACLFVARRLEAERVGVLFAAREGDLRAFPAPGLPVLPVDGLDPAAAAALLAERAGVAVADDVVGRLVERTGGNPLGLIELPPVLTAGQLAGREPLPAALPLTQGVERVFLERVRRLPAPAQTLLLVAAAEDAGRLATVLQAAGALGAGTPALAEAERAGLVQVRDGRLDFRHPLVRSAVYQGATTAERQTAHRALADALPGESDQDRRVWHRAAAAFEPDEAVAGALEKAGRRAGARSGFVAACAALERAAELTPDAEPRARRLVAGAEYAWLAGHLAKASDLLQRARPDTSDPVGAADLQRLRGKIEWGVGSAVQAVHILVQAARDIGPLDQSRALEMLAVASEAASFAADSEAAVEIGRLAAQLQPGDGPRERFLASLLVGLGHHAAGDVVGTIRWLRQAIELGHGLDETDLLAGAGRAAFYIDDDGAAHRLHEKAVARARAAGAVSDVLPSLHRLTLAEILSGRWTAATASATDALRLARETGQHQHSVTPLVWLALLAALRGEEERFRSLAAQTEQSIAAHPTGIAETELYWARGLHELAGGRADSAVTALRQMSHPAIRFLATVDRVEAAVHAGRREVAEEWLAPLERFAAHGALPGTAARVAHCRALLATGETAERLHREALDGYQQVPRPFERARVELAYGEFLRRARRRADARPHLRAALDVFEHLGAAPWAERARSELRASGQTVRARDPSALRQLTPQETQVARFVAQGLPNREVAAQLFLSPRTVDYHLRNVFTKLGISSRTELARLTLA